MKFRFKLKDENGNTMWYDFVTGESGVIVPVIENGRRFHKLPDDLRMQIIDRLMKERLGV